MAVTPAYTQDRTVPDPPFASEPASIEHSTSRFDHGADHEPLEAVGQEVSELFEVECTELFAGVGCCQHPGSLWSTTSVSGELFGAAHQ